MEERQGHITEEPLGTGDIFAANFGKYLLPLSPYQKCVGRMRTESSCGVFFMEWNVSNRVKSNI